MIPERAQARAAARARHASYTRDYFFELVQRHTLAYFGFWIVTQRQQPTGLPNDRKETQHTTFGCDAANR